MKKLFLSFFLLSAFLISNGQAKFGAKAGLNLASTKSSFDGRSITSSSIASIAIGAFANVSLSEKFKIQPELLYAGYGGEDEGIKVNTGYITIPILAQLYVAKKVYFQAGPQFGLLVNSKAGDLDYKDFYKSNDLQVLFGGGVHITQKLSLDARYGLSMINIAKDAADFNVNNRAISLTLGYAFN